MLLSTTGTWWIDVSGQYSDSGKLSIIQKNKHTSGCVFAHNLFNRSYNSLMLAFGCFRFKIGNHAIEKFVNGDLGAFVGRGISACLSPSCSIEPNRLMDRHGHSRISIPDCVRTSDGTVPRDIALCDLYVCIGCLCDFLIW